MDLVQKEKNYYLKIVSLDKPADPLHISIETINNFVAKEKKL